MRNSIEKNISEDSIEIKIIFGILWQKPCTLVVPQCRSPCKIGANSHKSYISKRRRTTLRITLLHFLRFMRFFGMESQSNKWRETPQLAKEAGLSAARSWRSLILYVLKFVRLSVCKVTARVYAKYGTSP